MKLTRELDLNTFTWAQVDDLIDYFGGNQSDVVQFILTSWLSANGKMVREYKTNVDALEVPE